MATSISYSDFISAVQNYYGTDNPYGNLTWAKVSNDLLEAGVDRTNYYNYLESYPSIFNVYRTADGKIADVSIKNDTYFGGTGNIGESINSNQVGSIAGSKINLEIPNIVSTSTTGKLELTGGIGLKADTGLTATGVLSTIGTAIGAVGIGAKLGKIIGDSLYTSNPSIWDDGVISGLSQVDWNKFAITLKDDVSGRVQNGILGLFGVDGDNTTMYLDENAVGYLTWYMQDKGMLNESTYLEPTDEQKDMLDSKLLNRLNFPLKLTNFPISFVEKSSGKYRENNLSASEPSNNIVMHSENLGSWGSYYASENDFSVNYSLNADGQSNIRIRNSTKFNKYNKTYYGNYGGTYSGDTITVYPLTKPYNDMQDALNLFSNSDFYYLLLYGNTFSSTDFDGISNNNNSTQFDPTGIGSVATALGALRNQYPELWDNSITKTIPQKDGSEEEHVYLPIPIPKFNNAFDTQPTTGTPDQKDPQVDPSTTPEEDQKNLADTIAPPTTPSDDTNTGTGDTPTIITPNQQASSLWAIYNPSLSQLNSLGSWLWSTDFIDQLLKIFNDPMQAIIGLHKVYATPVISGSGNIKVGYLDSGVPSNIVGNQYTYINCGSVSLREYYGNVLDYSPYTTVQLYLPFIGIVSLDIADVSRSTISVKYGVDVLTGACLASVSVQRDNAGGVLYQYSGNCACQYPLSSGSYMGMVTGMIGALGSLARGNIFGTAMSVAGMHTNIEHSGGFSGNAGAMGAKKPYLIVSRPQSAMNDGFPAIQGYPSNYYIRLGNCSGYTQVAECHVENIPATEKELDKIKDLLKEGIIL